MSEINMQLPDREPITLTVAELEYTKDWKDPNDFPTYEPDEIKVREDMQFLYDEIRDYLNDELIPGFEGLADDMDAMVDEVATAIINIVEEVNNKIPETILTGASYNNRGALTLTTNEGKEIDLGKVVHELTVNARELAVRDSTGMPRTLGALLDPTKKVYVTGVEINEQNELIVTTVNGVLSCGRVTVGADMAEEWEFELEDGTIITKKVVCL